MKPISLLIPCYNAASYLPSILEAARNQTMPFAEIICYDDASNDNTVDILEKAGVRLLRGKENHGAGYARNRLLEAARGDYVHFHDADDYLSTRFVETLLPHMMPESAVVCACEVRKPDTQTVETMRHPTLESEPDLAAYFINKFVHLNSLIYPRGPLLELGGFHEELRIHEDKVFNIELAARGLRYHYVDEPLVAWVRNAESTLSSTSRLRMQQYNLMAMNLAQQRLPQSNHRILGSYILYQAWELYCNDHVNEAREAIQLANRCGVRYFPYLNKSFDFLQYFIDIETLFWLRRLWVNKKLHAIQEYQAPSLPLTKRAINKVVGKQKPSVCTNISEWIENGGEGEISHLYPSFKLTRKVPCTLERELSKSFLDDQSFEVPAKYLAIIPQARIYGPDGFIILPDGSHCLETVGGYDSMLTEHPCYYQALRPPVKRLNGRYFSLMSLWCRAHYHWLHDSLQRLYLVLHLLPNDIQFLVPSDLKDYQKAALTALGISSDRLVPYQASDHLELETLYFSPLTTPIRFDLPDSLNWVASKLGTWAQKQEHLDEAERRIYITRKKAAIRKVSNEEELLPLLHKYGFKQYVLEDLSFAKQIQLFQQAEAVVSPHGAGLTQLMFCRPGTKVLEIFPDPIKSWTHYWSISRASYLDYWYVRGNAVATASHWPDIQLPKTKLEKSLLAMKFESSEGK